jgi:hypothetical protein
VQVLLAELEIWHSRRIAPTRRVALGRAHLPVEPAPGFGGVLLGGIVAAHVTEVDPELLAELVHLIDDLEAGHRIPQPRLRHRFQVDRIGLARSSHRLLGHGDALDFDLGADDQGSPESQVLGAVYAAGRLDPTPRRAVMGVLRRAVRWRGPVGPALVAQLTGASGVQARSVGAFADPEQWALQILGFGEGVVVARGDVNRRFRQQLRLAHPDHGGASDAAAQRIADLSEARRILLATAS